MLAKRGSDAPDDVIARLLVVAQHFNEGHGTLAQPWSLNMRRAFCLVGGLFVGNGGLQGGDGGRNFSRLNNALGSGRFADHFKHMPAIGFQHDHVAGIFGFEFVQHAKPFQ